MENESREVQNELRNRQRYTSCRVSDLKDRVNVTEDYIDHLMDSPLKDLCDLLFRDDG